MTVPITREPAVVVRPPVERDTIRVGVIGAGFGASVHVPALRRVPGVEVRAICGARPERIRDAAYQLAIPAVFTDYREMLLSDEIDAVTIAAPSHLHHGMALAACEAGVHTLCDKPMASNVAEARDMLRMAREAGICHAIAHQARHDPARAEMKRLVDEGFLGTLHAASVSVFRPLPGLNGGQTRSRHASPARAGGIVGAIGSNYVDALRWWFGDVHAACGAVHTASTDPAPRLAATGGNPGDSDEDNAAFILRFASGALATVHLCYTSANDLGEQIVATGSEGTLVIRDGGLSASRHGGPFQSILQADRGGLDNAGHDALARDIRAFSILAGEWVLAMRTGADASPSFEDGAKVQEIVDAVSRSQQLSRWIDLSGNKWPV